jgi:hypothetical protein
VRERERKREGEREEDAFTCCQHCRLRAALSRIPGGVLFVVFLTLLSLSHQSCCESLLGRSPSGPCFDQPVLSDTSRHSWRLQLSIAKQVGTVKSTVASWAQRAAGKTGAAPACMLIKGALPAAAPIEAGRMGQPDAEMVKPGDNPPAGPNLVPQATQQRESGHHVCIGPC